MLPSLGREGVNLETVNGVSPAALLDAVTDLMESVSFEAPLVIHLDDFQWMDRETRTLILSLASRSLPLRVLFLISGRRDLASGNWKSIQSSLEKEAMARSLTLQPLALEDVWELLALVAEFPDPEEAQGFAFRVHQASAGNPLFIRGLLQELHDQGIFSNQGGDWVLHTNQLPVEFGFPEDIRTLLGERLERLSEGASQLAGTLAHQGKASPPKALARALGMEESAVMSVVAELLEREVLCWVDGEKLDFCHDLLRDAALARSSPAQQPDPGWKALLRRHRMAAVFIAGILLAIPLGAFWGGVGILGGAEEGVPRYGGGTLVFFQQDGDPLTLQVGPGPAEEWVQGSLRLHPGGGLKYLARTVQGGILQLGKVDAPGGPDISRVYEDGSEEILFSSQGDLGLQDISPEGTRVLFRSERAGEDRFITDLYWGELETGEKHLLHESRGPLGFSRWSQDGDLVAFIIRGRVDTLAVVSLAGERIRSTALDEIRGIGWCGDRLLTVAEHRGQISLYRYALPDLEGEVLEEVGVWTHVHCSPDGEAVAYLGLMDGQVLPIIREMDSGRVEALPSAIMGDQAPAWIPDQVGFVPMEVRVEEDTVRIQWGERRPLAAEVLDARGESSSSGLRWESLDPSVATCTEAQGLTGNGAGIGRVVARWGHSLADTVVVVVEETGNSGALLRDRFESIDSTRWAPFGDPIPISDSLDGYPVLRLTGDEKYGEGLILRDPLPLEQGLTVEWELKLEPTREVHQNFQLCLRDFAADDEALELAVFRAVNQAVCFLYPAREFEKLDWAEGTMTLGLGAETLIRSQELLPPRDWVHMALQVRADGQLSFVLNRRVVAISSVHMRAQALHVWRLTLGGDAVDSEVFLRNLSIWPETRYTDTEDGEPGGD
jgi:hypothetical protein